MFTEIPAVLSERMAYLEKLDQKDRSDGTPRNKRLRQITRDTGKFLSLLTINIPEGEIIEIGTSAGYSTLWLAFAAKEKGKKVKTFELDEAKINLARETFRIAGLEDTIELVQGDFLDYGHQLGQVALCFLDAEKEVYEKCFRLVSGHMVRNGLIVADNAIDHYEGIKPMIDLAELDERFDCLMVPVGNGEFICRRK
ncbi:O-methyltransferase [Pedobacter nutrimenti]|jgi:predicted O-methyltransferase YrrM|uniref:Putative O-methyltransferase YrrM n=1 Tax=Pedobacter nutrimenti TaxID=1241337 RepID=A0A318UEZ9_9SPHI|nr:class I SAM-dependent methyltransferase [Pedobacter nutrimenti]PYF75004.1 putative O-methyltransferase YrrM [Pedobacter nutrimenti]